MNPNSNEFASRILDAYTSTNNLKPVMNPATRYVRVDRETSRPAADNRQETYERDRRSLAANPASGGQTPGVQAPVKQTPSDPKPQSTRAANPDDGQTVLRLEFNKDTLLSGFMMSEVLGKPKCFGMGRRPVKR